jgi:hypothetical protein
MIKAISAALLLLAQSSSATYVVTCHSDGECGSVCGRYSSDIVAPTEGLFGTSCNCGGNGATTYKCTAFGVSVSYCNAGAPPCSTACNQKICISKDGKRATGTVLSACPKHHPDNVNNCCSHPSSRDYCTCVIQDTLDINWQPYQQLGNTNGYSSGAVWGACGSQLESLNIHINTTRASELVQPFLRSGDWCKQKDMETDEFTEVQCHEIQSVDECNASPTCSYCKSDKLKAQCYKKDEADVLSHISSVEKQFTFTCDAQ